MHPEHVPLWQRIERHPLDKPGVAHPFSRKLAAENHWTRDHAERAIGEYKRFVLLALVAGHHVAPSDEVDRVWHLHLTYSRDYWQEFCPNVLGRPLHHVPSEGGAAEQRAHRASYARTLASYRRIFGEDPPPQLWPPLHERAAARYARVDTTRVLVLPKPRLGLGSPARRRRLLLALAPCALLLGCRGLDGPTFLVLYVLFCALLFGIAQPLARWLADRGAPSEPLPPVDVFGVAYLGGGPARVVQVAVARLMCTWGPGQLVDGVLRQPDTPTAPPSGREALTSEGKAIEEAALAALQEARFWGLSLEQLRTHLAPTLDALAGSLRKAGLAPEPHTARVPLLVSLLAPLVALVRIVEASARGKPVIFLVLLGILALVYCLLVAIKPLRCTSRGDACLSGHRQWLDAVEAPRDHDVPPLRTVHQLALAGIAALVHTELAPLAHAARAEGASGGCSAGGCSAGGGDSSCGGGGDGGGCGGCGGD